MDKFDLSIKAQDLREKLGVEDPDAPLDILSLASQIDSLTLVYYPLGEKFSSITVKDPVIRLVVLNSELSLGRVRSALAHALYHLYFEQSFVIHVCPQTLKPENDTEKEADCFASYFLASYRALQKRIRAISGNKPLSLKNVIALEQYFGMSHEMMCQRLSMEGFLSKKQINAFPEDVTLTAARLGFDERLYQPMPEALQKRTTGHYLRQADALREKGLVSLEEIEALLHDAFRDDVASFLHTKDSAGSMD